MLIIRRFEPEDHEAVWELHNLALSQVGAHAGPGLWDHDFQDIPGVYFDAGGEFLVGLIEGRIVAMGALRRLSKTEAEVKRMRVHPDFQRRGFGQEMLEALEAKARFLGFRSLSLDTTTKQPAAQSLFLKNGYTVTGRTHWRDMEMLFYEKMLSS